MKSDGSVFTLENEELLIMVERHGSQLSRIYDKKSRQGRSCGAQTRQYGTVIHLSFFHLLPNL